MRKEFDSAVYETKAAGRVLREKHESTELIMKARTSHTIQHLALQILLISVALLFIGCREKLSEGFHRSGSSEFTTDESKAVDVAKAELERATRKRIDARYKVTRVPEGFSVHVSYVAGYQRGRPVFIPGGFCVVLVSTQWTAIKILGGA